ncbi:hypothetical protein [Streptomyces curacoi]|uniref:hypothetical protein n=1 Tax=Streptomyces curacoi TaxID=146536 RepID=UPI000B183BD6|nr:hypothetical protein [Streptomyces curacoi]
MTGALGLVVGGVLDVGAADPWASVAGGAAGLIGLAVTLYAFLGPAPTAAAVTASGTRAVAAGGSIGAVSTGDGTSTTPPPPTTPGSPTRPASGPVTASGERSVAAGGDIGSVSAGDG